MQGIETAAFTSVRVRGPLMPHVEGLWSRLLERGYSPLSCLNLLRLVAHLSRWLEDGGVELGEFTSDRVGAFAAERRQRGYTQFLTVRALSEVLAYLRELRVIPPPATPAVDETPVGRLLRDYEQYLRQERSLCPSTVARYGHFASRLMEGRVLEGQWDLTPTSVTSFVLAESRRTAALSRASAVAIRSLVRFLTLRGEIDPGLSGCIPAIAQWRLASLPQALESDQVQAVLAACDSESVRGRRDGAIVLLLVRLGLRAAEVASLQLGDIDWRSGELLVRGKGGSLSRMPLPLDVGHALATYLHRDRPASRGRHAFLGFRAPFRPLQASGVIAATTRVLRSAGIDVGGAHVLRHTAATQLLRGGASLAEIGHVLRHRNLDTTAIYAKVDDASLRALARAWPGGVR